MKLRNTVIVVATVAMAATIQTAQASVDLGTEASLAALNNTDTYLTIGDKIFSGFSYLAIDLTSFDASQIQVTASIGANGVYYLAWDGIISIASSGHASGDLLLGYTVTANPGVIIGIDQSYTGSGQPASGTFLAVDETVKAGTITVGSSHLERGDLSDPPGETVQGDVLIINPPQSTLTVTKDIGLSISSTNGGFVTISQVEQSFEQVPEPTTMIAGALLLLPLGASTLRILRRNRMS